MGGKEDFYSALPEFDDLDFVKYFALLQTDFEEYLIPTKNR